MGFWKKVGNFFKDAATGIVIATAETAKYVGEKLNDAGKWIDETISKLGKKEAGPQINIWKDSKSSETGGETGSSPTNEELEKRERERK